MAFVCDGCHEKGTGRPGSVRHMTVSYGRCEMCGQPASCFDCKCQFRQGWNVNKGDEKKQESGASGTNDLSSLSKLPENAAARDVMLHILHWTGNMERLTPAGKYVYLTNALNHAVNYLYSLSAEDGEGERERIKAIIEWRLTAVREQKEAQYEKHGTGSAHHWETAESELTLVLCHLNMGTSAKDLPGGAD